MAKATDETVQLSLKTLRRQRRHQARALPYFAKGIGEHNLNLGNSFGVASSIKPLGSMKASEAVQVIVAVGGLRH